MQIMVKYLLTKLNKAQHRVQFPVPTPSPVPNKPYGFCGLKAPRKIEDRKAELVTLNSQVSWP